MGIGWQQIMVILVIVVVIFGAGKLPQIGEGMGRAIKNFKKSVKDVEDATDITPNEEAPRSAKREAIKSTNNSQSTKAKTTKSKSNKS